MKIDKSTRTARLHNGVDIWWTDDPQTPGNRRYFHNECGHGVPFWDDSITSRSTIIAVLEIDRILKNDDNKLGGDYGIQAKQEA